jgi:ferric-dicitrate binding protein FerR (iron transport regulator)
MDVNRIWILIGKKVSGEASPQDIAELESLLSGRIDNMYPLRELEEMWRSGKTGEPLVSPIQVQERWQKFKELLPDGNQNDQNTTHQISRFNIFTRLPWLAAACILLVGLISFAIWSRDNNDELITTVVKAPAGSISEVKLPDGTKVWLNAGSRLTYKKVFGKHFREVTLLGEAYFDVVKDARHPFIVTTSFMRLKVLGTAFNVRSFTNDRTSEASLVRGSIEVTLLNNPDKKIILKPSEKITIRNPQTKSQNKPAADRLNYDQLPLITLSTVHYQQVDSLPDEAKWMENKLVFTSEKFEDLASRMERYFNVTIQFEDESVKMLVLSGGFKDENILDAMKALQVTGNFRFKINKNQITIYK